MTGTSAPASDRSASAPGHADLSVNGMHCGSCVAVIEETLGEVAGVRAVSVDLESGRAAVDFDPEAISVGDLCSVVTDLGYPAEPLVGSSSDPQ